MLAIKALISHYGAMKKFICYVLILSALFVPLKVAAAANGTTNSVTAPTVYIIPIQGMIERGLHYVVNRGVKEAVANGADAIVFDMNTPGGYVYITEDIIRTLIDLPTNITTYTFVNKDALSAGSMIAIATRHIYMAPGSRIGASAVVGLGKDLKEGDLKEKHVSALTALVRDAAERNGHDPNLIEAMIRKDMQYKVGNRIICKAGQLLTLNDITAAESIHKDGKAAPLLVAGTAKDLPDMLQQAGLAQATCHTIKMTDSEKIARFIERFAFIFLAGGLLGIYIEFKTPGFGIPGISGIFLMAVFFWGHHIAGVSGGLEVIIFAAGLLLLALEIFIIPGFGVAGVSGIALIVSAIFMAMVQHYPGTEWFKLSQIQIEQAITNLGLALLIATAGMFALAYILPKTPAYNHLVLAKTLADDSAAESKPTKKLLPGTKGSAATQLHPAGFGDFNGKRLNVVTRGNFIDKNTAIVIAELHGSRIVVEVDTSKHELTGDLPS
jgi:membrane-bound serine protease (ClpP class)